MDQRIKFEECLNNKARAPTLVYHCVTTDLVISFIARDSVVFLSQAKFGYSDHPLNHSLGLPFDYNGTLDILITPGQKGILIFWYENSLLVSRGAGE